MTESIQIRPTSPENLRDPVMVIYENPEKQGGRQLGPGDYMVRTSDRVCLSGMPGSGKRVLILNIVNRIDPKIIKAIHVVHSDPHTVEYDCLSELGAPVYMYGPDDLPTMENIEQPDGISTEDGNSDSEDEHFGKMEKEPEPPEEVDPNRTESIVIIDECPTESLGRIGKHRMERLVNHCATHKNTLVICSIQNLTNLPPNCRRGFNCYALYKQADAGCNQMAASRAGITHEELMDMFELCKTKHDFIFIDLDRPKDDPWRFRLNWFYPIQIERTIQS